LEQKEKIAAVIFTAAAIAFNFLYMGVPVIFLNVGLAISLIIWLTFEKTYSRKLSVLFIIGILIQLAHFLEEYNTGLYKELPSMFNAAPWTGRQFVIFNITWLFIFLLAAIGAFKKIKLSYLILWFFVLIGAIGNGVFHIGLSLVRGEYFPGTVTAFFLLAIGIIMIQNIASSPGNTNKNQSL